MSHYIHNLIIILGWLHEYSWLGEFNILLIPLLLLGLSKTIWTTWLYRLVALTMLFIFIVLSIISYIDMQAVFSPLR